MVDKGYSRRGLSGDIVHYDEHGKKIGTSSPSAFGGYNHYYNSGRKTGHSDIGLFGDYKHKK